MKTFELYIAKDQSKPESFEPFVTIALETTRPDGSPDNEYDYINSLMSELVSAYNCRMKWTCEEHTGHFFPMIFPIDYPGRGAC